MWDHASSRKTSWFTSLVGTNVADDRVTVRWAAVVAKAIKALTLRITGKVRVSRKPGVPAGRSAGPDGT
jgi:hypothetical protein